MDQNKYFESLTDEGWLEKLVTSIRQPNIDGIHFPGFPSEEIQAKFVGSSSEQALREGFEFYKLVKGYSSALGMPIQRGSRLLDFGCGWGRFLRLFWRDVGAEGLFGADIDPEILHECRANNVPGELHRLYPGGKLPFPDNFFDCVIAYSVFTHLPEHVHLHWFLEIARVSRGGAVFFATVEPPRFLDFIEGLKDRQLESGWHQGLAKFIPRMQELRVTLQKDGFVYLPTGGGSDHRTSDIYGDCVISQKYVNENWSSQFSVREYIDDPNRFWQAIAICQRP